jgi:hypothetical protein
MITVPKTLAAVINNLNCPCSGARVQRGTRQSIDGSNMKTLGYSLLVGLLRLLSLLPFPLVAAVGSYLGAVLYEIPSHRKHVGLVNLRLCFPMKTDREREHLARAHLQHLVRSYLERGFHWFRKARSINRPVQMDGRIDLHEDKALSERETVMLLGESPKQLLLVCTGRIGDVVPATPVMRSLKHKWPGAEIHALVFEGTEGAIENNRDVSRIIAVKRRATRRERLAKAVSLWRK